MNIAIDHNTAILIGIGIVCYAVVHIIKFIYDNDL